MLALEQSAILPTNHTGEACSAEQCRMATETLILKRVLAELIATNNNNNNNELLDWDANDNRIQRTVRMLEELATNSLGSDAAGG